VSDFRLYIDPSLYALKAQIELSAGNMQLIDVQSVKPLGQTGAANVQPFVHRISL
jgi:hypothetical protein